MIDYHGTTVLVTGGASGIGKARAAAFLDVFEVVHVHEQHRCSCVLQTCSFVAAYQAVVEKIDLRCLEDGPGHVAVEGPYNEHHVQGFENVEIAGKRVGGDVQIARDRRQRQR